MIETAGGRAPAHFTAPVKATQVEVAIKARMSGLHPYRVRFDVEQKAWIVTVIDWKRAA